MALLCLLEGALTPSRKIRAAGFPNLVAYRFSMNGYEKGLVRDMLGKFTRFVRIR